MIKRSSARWIHRLSPTRRETLARGGDDSRRRGWQLIGGGDRGFVPLCSSGGSVLVEGATAKRNQSKRDKKSGSSSILKGTS